MSSILCLAHYCDNHGPTPMMVTQGLPVGCTSCFEDEHSTRRPSTGSRSFKASDILAGGVRNGSKTNSSSDKENGIHSLELQRSSSMRSQAPNAIETPPGSPRVAALQTGQNANSRRRDSSFRKTYDENDRERAIPCENCALTLPKKTKDGDTSAQSPSDKSGPILRTRKPYERVALHMPEPSPPKSSDSSESDDSKHALTSNPRRPSRTTRRAGTSSSNSSFDSGLSHTHYLDYTSTHEPLAPTPFSIIRQSCLRTLTCETLPPSSTQYTSSAPSSPFINTSFSSGPTGSTSSGGPIFFGDPLAGYTTAFIFRIPDPTARGRRRVYALMALSTHRERLAMQTFSFLSAAFRDLAAWIQGLAEQELERSESAGSPRTGGESTNHTPTSSFLSGRSRGGFDGMRNIGPKPKGLAELVGLPDFFIELHTRFVRLLIELGLLLGSG